MGGTETAHGRRNYNCECLAIAVQRRLTSQDVQEYSKEPLQIQGCPTHIRSDNGPECIARMLRQRNEPLAVAPLFIDPGRTGELIRRIVQRKIAERIAERLILLYAAREAGDRGGMAPTLQYATTA